MPFSEQNWSVPENILPILTIKPLTMTQSSQTSIAAYQR